MRRASLRRAAARTDHAGCYHQRPLPSWRSLIQGSSRVPDCRWAYVRPATAGPNRLANRRASPPSAPRLPARKTARHCVRRHRVGRSPGRLSSYQSPLEQSPLEQHSRFRRPGAPRPSRCQRSLPRLLSAHHGSGPINLHVAVCTSITRAPASQNAEGHHLAVTALSGKMSGGVLLSHAVSHAVPSALKGLTSGFGMGPGVSPSLWPPKRYGDVVPRHSGMIRNQPGRPHLENRTVDANKIYK